MSATQLKWIAGLLVVAAALWLISEGLSERPDDRQTGRVLPESVEGVDQVVLTSTAETIVLAREGAVWKVNGLDISRERLAALFTALSDSSEYEVVARSPGVHARMGVDDAGTTATFFRGTEQVDQVLFGKRGADPETVFARRAGEDAVYRYAGAMAGLVDLGLDEWRDPIIVDVVPEMLGRVDVVRPDDRFSIERRERGWVLAPDTPLDSAAVSGVLRNYRSLRSRGFATAAQQDSIDFSRSQRRVTLVGVGGDTLVALAFDSSDSRFWVRSNRSASVFSLPLTVAEQVLPQRAAVLPAD